ncbi:hypothetical protein [Halorubrum sp. N11]|uniref:hypothetical protein n=1 Tax=Halorubrum sp. N11 TaxID=3402276 RepID=UPI003EBE3BD7
MSAEESEGTGRHTVRIDDPELGAALAEAEEEHGSKSEAMRSALRDSLLGTEGVSISDINGRKVPQKAVEGHRKLVEYTGVGGYLELDTAESILANHLNIQKDAVRRVVIKPLNGAGVVGISQGISQVSIVVGTEANPASDEGWAKLQASQEYHTAGEKVDDPSEVSDRLDELAAAGAEVADGE